MPSPYLDFFSQSIADSSGAGSNAAALLRQGLQSGRTFRLQAGIRPFRELGFYLDAGYSNVSLEGAIDGSFLRGVPVGEYEAQTSIDSWLLELGYQAWIGRHFTLAGAIGLNERSVRARSSRARAWTPISPRASRPPPTSTSKVWGSCRP